MDPSKVETPSRDEIKTTLEQLLNIARIAQLGPSNEELRRYIEAASRVDTVAPILDPTLWMKGSKKNDCFLKIARALATFRASLPTREEAEEADRVAASYR
ncbi:MAG TPA: hypothetical protein VK550_12165 [Polyangiaceae bacterium]|nr:hypothetical protein [Polyangiaceae bacterium]